MGSRQNPGAKPQVQAPLGGRLTHLAALGAAVLLGAGGLAWLAGLSVPWGGGPGGEAFPQNSPAWVTRFQPPAPPGWEETLAAWTPPPQTVAGGLPISPLEREVGPIEGIHWGRAVTPAPEGSRVYTTGWSFAPGRDLGYTTVAYEATTGAEIWSARYDGPAAGRDTAIALAVDPGGERVYVTGESPGEGTAADFATVAYDAATGEEIWVARYDGAGEDDGAVGVAVHPDGSLVFVTGPSLRLDPALGTTAHDYATVAYDAATGDEVWASRYEGVGPGGDQSDSLAVAPDGSRLYVTGSSERPGAAGTAAATVAYDTATGEEIWAARYDGPDRGEDWGFFVAAGPDGSGVYVTGRSGTPAGADLFTVAYDAATGAERWAARFRGEDEGVAWGRSIAPGPEGGTVYVTGFGPGPGRGDDTITIAYDAATGEERWVARYRGPGDGHDWVRSIAADPGGARVYVTGFSAGAGTDDDYLTIAYDARTGERVWEARYDGPASGKDRGVFVSVSPDGGWVYVTGDSAGPDGRDAFATIAYPAAGPPQDAAGPPQDAAGPPQDAAGPPDSGTGGAPTGETEAALWGRNRLGEQRTPRYQRSTDRMRLNGT